MDEFWEHREPNGIEKLKLRVYTYWLNNRSSEVFWGPIRAYYKDIKDKCLNDVRNDANNRTPDYQGWHFHNTGGLEEVRRKVMANYNNELFNDVYIKEKVDERYGKIDYLGRNFKLEVDETDWPPWLKEHRQDYKNMLK